jgi:hypothetical protein
MPGDSRWRADLRATAPVHLNVDLWWLADLRATWLVHSNGLASLHVTTRTCLRLGDRSPCHCTSCLTEACGSACHHSSSLKMARGSARHHTYPLEESRVTCGFASHSTPLPGGVCHLGDGLGDTGKSPLSTCFVYCKTAGCHNGFPIHKRNSMWTVPAARRPCFRSTPRNLCTPKVRCHMDSCTCSKRVQGALWRPS